jgi:hypothetical protein
MINSARLGRRPSALRPRCGDSGHSPHGTLGDPLPESAIRACMSRPEMVPTVTQRRPLEGSNGVGAFNPERAVTQNMWPYIRSEDHLMARHDDDNHSNQLNPNNDAYWESRGWDERLGDWEDRVNDGDPDPLFPPVTR